MYVLGVISLVSQAAGAAAAAAQFAETNAKHLLSAGVDTAKEVVHVGEVNSTA